MDGIPERICLHWSSWCFLRLLHRIECCSCWDLRVLLLVYLWPRNHEPAHMFNWIRIRPCVLGRWHLNSLLQKWLRQCFTTRNVLLTYYYLVRFLVWGNYNRTFFAVIEEKIVVASCSFYCFFSWCPVRNQPKTSTYRLLLPGKCISVYFILGASYVQISHLPLWWVELELLVDQGHF